MRERFDWEGEGMASGSIHVALVRVRRLAEPWEFAYEPRHGGCRSWIQIGDAPEGWLESAIPVISDQDFAALEGPPA